VDCRVEVRFSLAGPPSRESHPGENQKPESRRAAEHELRNPLTVVQGQSQESNESRTAGKADACEDGGGYDGGYPRTSARERRQSRQPDGETG